jgi:hypothetical protein
MSTGRCGACDAATYRVTLPDGSHAVVDKRPTLRGTVKLTARESVPFDAIELEKGDPRRKLGELLYERHDCLTEKAS